MICWPPKSAFVSLADTTSNRLVRFGADDFGLTWRSSHAHRHELTHVISLKDFIVHPVENVRDPHALDYGDDILIAAPPFGDVLADPTQARAGGLFVDRYGFWVVATMLGATKLERFSLEEGLRDDVQHVHSAIGYSRWSVIVTDPLDTPHSLSCEMQ